MRYLTKFEGFFPDPKFLSLNMDTQHLHSSISLYKLADKIYAVLIKDRQLRAMLFMRSQEYYE